MTNLMGKFKQARSRLFGYFRYIDPIDFEEIEKEEYVELFVKNKSKEDLKFIYEKIWESKTKEIDRYLSRSNYAWAFQVASFAGYFSVIGSKSYIENPSILYVVICIGLITSVAWIFINIGSNYWQRYWNHHIDLIEDEITGPLNKLILNNKRFSIGSVSDTIGKFILMIWVILVINYFRQHISFRFGLQVDIVVLLTSIATFYFIYVMYFGVKNKVIINKFLKKKTR